MVAVVENHSIASGMGYVSHGSTAGTERPTSYVAITWRGTVAPTNAVAATNIWIDTT